MDRGILYISPKKANLKRNTDFFSKMDPYVKITCGGLTKKTKTHNYGGKKPVWDETLKFKVNGQSFITISVFDEDLTSDDHVGSANYNLEQVFRKGSHFEWIELTHKNKRAGEIFIEFDFTSEASATGYAGASGSFYTSGYGSSMGPGPSHYSGSAPAYPGGGMPSYSPQAPPASGTPFASYQPTSTPPTQFQASPSYPSGGSYAPSSQPSPSYSPSSPSYMPPGSQQQESYSPYPSATPTYYPQAPSHSYPMQSQPMPASPVAPPQGSWYGTGYGQPMGGYQDGGYNVS